MRATRSAVLLLLLLALAQPSRTRETFRYAVCLCGSGEGFEKASALNLRQNLLRALPNASHVDTFLTLRGTAGLGNLATLELLGAVTIDFDLSQEDESQRLSGAGNCTPFLPAVDAHARKWLTRWERVASCYDAVAAFEVKFGKSYDYVVHARLVCCVADLSLAPWSDSRPRRA